MNSNFLVRCLASTAKTAAAVLFLCGATRLEAALTIGEWVPKFKGVDLSMSTNIPPGHTNLSRRQVVSALRIDLSDPDIRLFTTPRISGYQEGDREIAAYTVSDFLRNNQLQAAINANFFSEGSYYLPPGTPMDVYGIQVSEGVVVSKYRPGQAATLLLDANNVPTIVTNASNTSTEGVYTAVAGNDALLVAGRNVGRRFDVDPRTVFGISEDRRYLYLVAIDGRQPGYSDGATDFESGVWLQLLGAYDGINVDGGGSTTLVLEDSTGAPQRINRSSAVADSGNERTVGSHLGIFAKPVPGFINDVVVTPQMNSATVSWTTIEPATSEVQYGLTAELGNSSGTNATLSATHSVELTGLTPETDYFYRIVAVANGQERLSSVFRFMTTNHVTTNLVIDFTNSWKYRYTSLDGVNWTSTNYDDSAWSGPGAGLLWVDTRSNPNPDIQPRGTEMPFNTATDDPYVTYYFRTHVSLAGMAPGSALLFSCYIDDGAAFYLNGTEIYRVRLPAGATYSTVATGFPCAGDAECLDEFKIPLSSLPSLVDGDNVLAVEVHNYNVGSADITFGLALNRIDPIDSGPTSTVVQITFVENGLEVTWDGTGGILQSAPSLDGPWADTQSSSPKPVLIQPSETRLFYRVRK